MTPYYDHAGITIYHGDCCDVLPSLEADTVVTDPPYGIYIKGGKWGKKYALQWDRETAPWLVEYVAGKTAAIWGGNHYALPPSRGWLVWHKLGAARSMSAVELCWTSLDIPAQFIALPKIGCVPNIHEGQHPTQKPVPLMRWCLSFMPDGVVLDPFMGSGTTLVAAKNLGRRAIGIELDERYCEIAAQRLQQECLPLSVDEPVRAAR
jgi:DNA modification methylase